MVRFSCVLEMHLHLVPSFHRLYTQGTCFNNSAVKMARKCLSLFIQCLLVIKIYGTAILTEWEREDGLEQWHLALPVSITEGLDYRSPAVFHSLLCSFQKVEFAPRLHLPPHHLHTHKFILNTSANEAPIILPYSLMTPPF